MTEGRPEFLRPDFLDGTSPEEIQERMMNELPADIDDMPGGFPYDMNGAGCKRTVEFSSDPGINGGFSPVCMGRMAGYAWKKCPCMAAQCHLCIRCAENNRGCGDGDSFWAYFFNRVHV